VKHYEKTHPYKYRCEKCKTVWASRFKEYLCINCGTRKIKLFENG